MEKKKREPTSGVMTFAEFAQNNGYINDMVYIPMPEHIEAYANYFHEQMSAKETTMSVKDAIEKEYPTDYSPNCQMNNKHLIEPLRAAMLKGYHLKGTPIDWDKVKEKWIKENPIQLSEIGINKIFDFLKSHIHL